MLDTRPSIEMVVQDEGSELISDTWALLEEKKNAVASSVGQSPRSWSMVERSSYITTGKVPPVARTQVSDEDKA